MFVRCKITLVVAKNTLTYDHIVTSLTEADVIVKQEYGEENKYILESCLGQFASYTLGSMQLYDDRIIFQLRSGIDYIKFILDLDMKFKSIDDKYKIISFELIIDLSDTPERFAQLYESFNKKNIREDRNLEELINCYKGKTIAIHYLRYMNTMIIHSHKPTSFDETNLKLIIEKVKKICN